MIKMTIQRGDVVRIKGTKKEVSNNMLVLENNGEQLTVEQCLDEFGLNRFRAVIKTNAVEYTGKSYAI